MPRKFFMIDVSCIIVSWNAKDLLAKCLYSLNRNNEQNKLEIIVVDNASDDGAPEMVVEYFPNVVLIRNDKNLGFSKANNIGIKISRGKYVCLINSDAIVLKGCIESLREFMDDHPDIGVTAPKLLNADFTLQRNCGEFPSLWNTFCRTLAIDTLLPNSKIFSGQLMRYFDHNETKLVDFLSGAFIMVRRSAINEVGFLDEDYFFYGEDKDWCKRFWKCGWKIILNPMAKAIHYGGGSTEDTVKYYKIATESNLKFYDKFYGTTHKTLFRKLLYLHLLSRLYGYIIFSLIHRDKKEIFIQKIQKNLECIAWLRKYVTDRRK